MLISRKNIRATAYSEFWGTEFKESIYLWEGAKHQIPFSKWDKVDAPTLKDQFATEEQIRLAHDCCKKVYLKFLPLISVKLNEIHRLNHPVSFWRAVLGRWLFEYICVVYEKYAYLSQLDLEHTSIKLLDKASFYAPKGFVDSFEFFNGDDGVQQLVSHYYYLFSQKKFPVVSKEFDFCKKPQHKRFHDYLIYIAKRPIKDLARKLPFRKNHPVMALLKTYIYRELIQELISETDGRIQRISLPRVEFLSNKVNYEKRKKILEIETNKDSFEYFLAQTLYYSIPRAAIECFSAYYHNFLRDIKAKRFDYIVSEAWIGHIATGIYVAIAQLLGKKLIFAQHGAYTQLCSTNAEWFQFSVADTYLTTGWAGNLPNVTAGGFACRKVAPCRNEPWKKDILYVCNAWPLYMVRFMNGAVGNTASVGKLRATYEFIELLPDSLRRHLVLRLRPLRSHWNSAHLWEVEKKAVRLDNVHQNLLVSISNAKIVIIDHFSTSFAEILTSGVPCLVLWDRLIEPLSDEYKDSFDNLVKVGVAHNSVQSLISQLVRIYDDTQQWWESEPVQTAVNKLKSKTLGHPSKTANYLLSCVR